MTGASFHPAISATAKFKLQVCSELKFLICDSKHKSQFNGPLDVQNLYSPHSPCLAANSYISFRNETKQTKKSNQPTNQPSKQTKTQTKKPTRIIK